MMRIALFLFLIVSLFSCSPAARLGLQKSFESKEQSFQDHTGFMLYDIEKQKTVYEYKSDRYFIPGSNTKILTFYTALRILGDSVPALNYVERNDSLIFWGTGDPSFLYKFTFNNNRTYDFLLNAQKPLYFSNSNFHTSHFGSGWAWDDYNSAYSPERSPFPVYGNIFTVEKQGSLLTVHPPLFDDFLSIGDRKEKEEIVREVHSNKFQFHPGVKPSAKYKEWDIPMKIDQQLIVDLLSDTLQKKIYPVNVNRPPLAQPFFSILSDSLYREMMQDSDNFIAEQLLLMCADVVRDSLQTEIAIKYALENYLNDLPDKPIWIDGSGLSRYNLFTPRTIVKIWHKIYELVPRDRLMALLATGGLNGTIKNWYKADTPFIFGKTGTLSNNHALSGFLVTRSGKTLIFAFMSNNYVATTSDIRRNMQNILKNIYDNY